MTAEEIIKQIELLSNAEKIKLLDYMYQKHFDNRPPREVINKIKHDEAWGNDDE
jgi:hypothetical protein